MGLVCSIDRITIFFFFFLTNLLVTIHLTCLYVTFLSAALGPGWCIGFLGLLHMDVFKQRLEQEFDANVIITAPNIPYKGKFAPIK